MNKNLLFTLLLVLVGFSSAIAQLKFSKEELEFEDDFNRLETVNFINEGTTPILIDSITYNSNLYTVRFNKVNYDTLIIEPGDSLSMDCILSGYFQVTSKDTTDSLKISYNSGQSFKYLKVKIDFYDDVIKEGTIAGNVSFNGIGLDSTVIRFYYGGSYLFKRIITDNNGNFSANLPIGNYILSAQRRGYAIQYFDGMTGPLGSEIIKLENDSTKTANFILTPSGSGGITLSGQILDAISAAPLNNGIVIVRTGKHTPNKISGTMPSVIQSAKVNYDGTFKFENLTGGTYFLQSFSNYFIPTFFSHSSQGDYDWHHGDSLQLNSDLSNINITMQRDSAFGAGNVSGRVSPDSGANFPYSDFIVYAISANSNSIVNYSLVDQNGNYSIDFLPYGTFGIVAQKIGYPDAISNTNVIIQIGSTSYTNIDLVFKTSSIKDEKQLPGEFKLYQNYPNPFNPSTNIKFYIPGNSNVRVLVYNILGQIVTELQNGELAAGEYNISFDAKNLSSGTYFVSLITNFGIKTKKILLLK